MPGGVRLSIHHSSFRIPHFISNPFLSVITILNNRAALAQRVAGAAELATVADEVDVEGVELAGGHEEVHRTVRELVGALRGDEADAAQDPEDVRVEREDILAAGEQKRAGGGLRADAAEPRQIAQDMAGGQPPHEGEVERAVPLLNLAEQAADDGGLLVGESAEAYCVGECLPARAQH